MATRKWFVITDGAELGPLGPVGLRRLVRRGEIGVDTPIRREDQREPVAAARVLGLFPAAETAPATPRHHGPHPKVYGPYTGLRPLGIATAATLFGFALLGVCGIVVAVRQLRFVADFADSYALVSEGEAPLFGAGVFAVLALVATGGLFVWWIWIARVNLPHLIHARIRYAPSWAAIAWFVPVLNLGLPYAVVAEIDRLSAEAEADGEATVTAKRALLLPWWFAALLGTAAALTYLLSAPLTIEALRFAAQMHLVAAIATVVAGVLAGLVVLRVTRNQERAHDRHGEPVELHRERGRRLRRVRADATAAAH
ncbi:MAG: DUF4328 domain-containing protein [Planctomycetes bacterium]|nr:DUF4328 domain-containing protein [Planctomycetota bacterium]